MIKRSDFIGECSAKSQLINRNFTAFTPAKGGRRPLANSDVCRNAFTLAEVLITLAVIGVVAALTIPGLVQGYKKRVVETKLAKFYSTINQALSLSEVDNGDRLHWDALTSYCVAVENEDGSKSCQTGTEESLLWYNKYLAKYINALKVETAMDMSVPEDNYQVHDGLRPTDVIVYFPDGSALQFAGRGWNYYINAKDMVKDGRPEKWGITAFPFKLDNKMRIQPFPVQDETSDYACTAEGNGASCTGVIAKNGWKIPDDYPYKF